ncbi:hypothetical protein GGR57DRAFT_261027 [Xylariaceae sp. FL1272]|nr:hypothetical protein GGR57DRAFT_261027 [Xylariaceae sp. FL1272]
MVTPNIPIDDSIIDTSTILSHDDFGPQIETCTWALAALALFWLTLRIYCKTRKHRGLWWDDYVLIASWFCVVAANAATSAAISLGWGKQPWDVPFGHFPDILLALLISGHFSLLAAASSKTSFALTLLRISNGWVKWVVWFAIITMNVAMGISATFNWVQCTPVQKLFNVFIAGTCWPRSTLVHYNAFAAAYSGATDIILAVLPVKILWNMNMNTKERFGAMCAMGLGIFAGIISFVKIYSLTGTIEANFSASVQLTVLSIAETCVTIMASSIPILRALARDKAGPKSMQLFALNATQFLTLHRRRHSPSERDQEDIAPRRKFWKLGRKASSREQTLSKIVELDELSPSTVDGPSTGERSFV